ncbi:Lipoamide acyltransferase component of branched-chain alpha-keto acid dehydrogenase complex [Phytophthora citrophthora]|uniref:Dihydrolipoamide acetyltransferase component of pyruvate dehydrogenase complex n=1 Tax=Phytophthora citrophthora TaxID=4793 RepID=A0AAD9GUV1_9STRA|nr:Lipoamide acyltransferase component of branched-chain alpha-keto acid dehydrogenase complex [Phytophthora citrophthora]
MSSLLLRVRLGQRLATSRRSFHAGAVAAFPEIPFKLADIGEGIAEVEVLQWFVKSGDEVKQFQNVCEVQSDKATVEITSRYDGIVTKVHYEVGEMAKVGSTLIDIDVDDATAATVQGGGKKKASPGAPIPRKVPSPVIQEPVAVSTPVPEAPVTPTPVLSRIPIAPRTVESGEKFLTSPSVRRLAKEHSIDLHDVEGTGPQGRILKGDLLEYIRMLAAQPTKPAQPTQTATSTAVEPPSVDGTNATYLQQDTVVPLTPIQKMMVKSMNAALNIPHFGYADEIRMDALYDLRKELKPLAEARGVKLSFMPFIIKAASLALKHYPMLNATVNDTETELTMIAAHNISLAMDTPTGLIVPNVKNVQVKSIMEIAEDLNRLQQLAVAGKLAPADLTGGTFSISNIGSIGGTYMSPVLMVPQVAIGAVGRIQKLPRYDPDGNVEPMRLMNVSWSGDHRVIDGATMARFSNQWKTYLETPVSMLTEMS